mmetsp:Transcript_23722/g.46720  ORF Transcript_23722/g.46720 Transcript_23722/m.46720 type:complete len:1032 (-) Transcript_23722:24-3119(-)
MLKHFKRGNRAAIFVQFGAFKTLPLHKTPKQTLQVALASYVRATNEALSSCQTHVQHCRALIHFLAKKYGTRATYSPRFPASQPLAVISSSDSPLVALRKFTAVVEQDEVFLVWTLNHLEKSHSALTKIVGSSSAYLKDEDVTPLRQHVSSTAGVIATVTHHHQQLLALLAVLREATSISGVGGSQTNGSGSGGDSGTGDGGSGDSGEQRRSEGGSNGEPSSGTDGNLDTSTPLGQFQAQNRSEGQPCLETSLFNILNRSSAVSGELTAVEGQVEAHTGQMVDEQPGLHYSSFVDSTDMFVSDATFGLERPEGSETTIEGLERPEGTSTSPSNTAFNPFRAEGQKMTKWHVPPAMQNFVVNMMKVPSKKPAKQKENQPTLKAVKQWARSKNFKRNSSEAWQTLREDLERWVAGKKETLDWNENNASKAAEGITSEKNDNLLGQVDAIFEFLEDENAQFLHEAQECLARIEELEAQSVTQSSIIVAAEKHSQQLHLKISVLEQKLSEAESGTPPDDQSIANTQQLQSEISKLESKLLEVSAAMESRDTKILTLEEALAESRSKANTLSARSTNSEQSREQIADLELKNRALNDSVALLAETLKKRENELVQKQAELDEIAQSAENAPEGNKQNENEKSLSSSISTQTFFIANTLTSSVGVQVPAEQNIPLEGSSEKSVHPQAHLSENDDAIQILLDNLASECLQTTRTLKAALALSYSEQPSALETQSSDVDGALDSIVSLTTDITGLLKDSYAAFEQTSSDSRLDCDNNTGNRHNHESAMQSLLDTREAELRDLHLKFEDVVAERDEALNRSSQHLEQLEELQDQQESQELQKLGINSMSKGKDRLAGSKDLSVHEHLVQLDSNLKTMQGLLFSSTSSSRSTKAIDGDAGNSVDLVALNREFASVQQQFELIKISIRDDLQIAEPAPTVAKGQPSLPSLADLSINTSSNFSLHGLPEHDKAFQVISMAAENEKLKQEKMVLLKKNKKIKQAHNGLKQDVLDLRRQIGYFQRHNYRLESKLEGGESNDIVKI